MMEHPVPVFHSTSVPIDGSSKPFSLLGLPTVAACCALGGVNSGVKWQRQPLPVGPGDLVQDLVRAVEVTPAQHERKGPYSTSPQVVHT
jgi:hypothetical protein